jgi:hypothetical protein
LIKAAAASQQELQDQQEGGLVGAKKKTKRVAGPLLPRVIKQDYMNEYLSESESDSNLYGLCSYEEYWGFFLTTILGTFICVQ